MGVGVGAVLKRVTGQSGRVYVRICFGAVSPSGYAHRFWCCTALIGMLALSSTISVLLGCIQPLDTSVFSFLKTRTIISQGYWGI